MLQGGIARRCLACYAVMSLGRFGELGIGLRNPLSERILLKLPDLLNFPKYPPPINLLSEGVRFVLSQKKHPRDSTKTYSPRMLTFWDGAKMAPNHNKLLCAVDIRVITPLSILLCSLEELLCLCGERLLE